MLSHFFVLVYDVQLLEIFINLVVLELGEVTHAHALIQLLLVLPHHFFHLGFDVDGQLVKLVFLVNVDVRRILLV